MKNALVIVVLMAIARTPGLPARRRSTCPPPVVAPPMATQDKVQALEQKAVAGSVGPVRCRDHQTPRSAGSRSERASTRWTTG